MIHLRCVCVRARVDLSTCFIFYSSLLTLSKVLMALGKNNPGHINYRDSKLTRILKPSLSGNARMAVICCISPSDKYTEETKSTLQFATRAKLVKTSAISNEIIENESDVVAKLRLENIKTKMEIREKEKQLMEMAAKLQQSEFNGNPKTDTPTEMTQSICNNGKSILELESRLTTANDLVATLERQVDELSSQKNDALVSRLCLFFLLDPSSLTINLVYTMFL